MKKSTKVLLTSLGSIVVLLGAGVIWQWENVDAVIKWQTCSKEELVDQIGSQKKQAQEVLKSYGIEDIEDFTFEEEEEIRQGKLTLEQAMQKYGKKEEIASPEENQGLSNEELTETDDKNKEQTTQEGDTKAVIENAAMQMYGLKAKYIGQLGALERSARQEYSALSKEQKANGGINSLVSKYSGSAMALQGACDAEVNGVLASLKQELQNRNESTDIVNTMQATYEQEKTLKKAYYLSLIKS